MPIIGITGGIASGKTTFRQLLLERIDADFFDADSCARELLDTDERVQEMVRKRVSPRAISASGEPDRVLLRELIYSDLAKRRTLEAILHPVIRARWTRHAREASENRRMFVVDIPLLFETRAESLFDAILVVACTEDQQVARLVQHRHLSEELSRKIIGSQMRMAAKIRLATHVIWNGAPLDQLPPQAGLAAAILRKKYE